MQEIKRCFRTGVVAAFFTALVVGQTCWTKELCEDFVQDPYPFDGDPAMWYKPPWGPGAWTPAPDGEEGMDVERTGDWPAHLCTEEVFAGDVTVWGRASFRGTIQGLLAVGAKGRCRNGQNRR